MVRFGRSEGGQIVWVLALIGALLSPAAIKAEDIGRPEGIWFGRITAGGAVNQRDPLGVKLATSTMGYGIGGQVGVFVWPGVAVSVGIDAQESEILFESNGELVYGHLGVSWWIAKRWFVVGKVGMGSVYHEWFASDHSFAIDGTALPIFGLGLNRVWPLGGGVEWGVGGEVMYLYYYRAHDSIGFDSELSTVGGRSQVGLGLNIQLLWRFFGL
jgi:hypothetical protein